MKVVGQNTSSWEPERKYRSVQEFFVEHPDLSPLALVTLLRLPPWGKPWGKDRSLKPLSVARGVWWNLRAPGPQPGAGTSWDKLGQGAVLGQGQETPLELQGGGVRPKCLEERWVLNCHSSGIAHHSWNWKIRMCQCVVWINEDEMCCMNTWGAWSCRYPLGYSGSQGEKVDLYL